MRRVVLVALLLLGWAGARAQGGAGDAAAKREAAAIRATADRMIATGAPEEVAKGAALLEKASALDQAEANAEKNALERDKLRRELQDEHSTLKAAIPNLTPLVTTLVLAGTLIFQITQARAERAEKTLERKEEAKLAERKGYTDALQQIQEAEGISAAAALINTIETEPYRTYARSLATTLMMRAKTFEDFENLFTSVMDPVTPDKLEQLMQIARSVDAIYNPIKPEMQELWLRRQKRLPLTPEQTARLDYGDKLGAEQSLLSQRLATLLRARDASAPPLDLHGIGVMNADVSGSTLRGANISMTAWSMVNLEDCDLSEITQFQFSAFYKSAWWRVAAISPELLAHLKANYPHLPEDEYVGNTRASAEEYGREVARLEGDIAVKR